ncbi:hypothetical protein [Vibrio lentus]|uniref:hypothetical protein n=1 Tax=Vibrio lentus TaxID=136468 RepID=UPI000C845427|nr:hypothetical protein [Vibrio lentus]PMG99005.1 hypothetical protein BCU78_20655 [Vibrio lentus]
MFFINKLKNPVFIFLVIFSVKYPYIPVSSSKLIAFIGMFCLFVDFFFKNKKINITVIKYLIFNVLITSIILINVIFINSSNDYTFISKFVLIAVEIPLCAYVFLWINKGIEQNIIYIEFIRAFFLACVIQAIISLFLFIVPEIREGVFNILQYPEELIAMSQFRLVGIGYYFFDLAVIFGLGFFCFTYMLTYEKVPFYYYILVLILVIAGFLTARTFLIFIVLSVMFFITNRNFIFKFSKIIIFGVLGVFFLYFILPYNISDKFMTVIPWAFEYIFSLLDGSGVETSSTNVLKSMFVDYSYYTAMFGDGYYVDPKDPTLYYRSTDSGLMRPILYFGFPAFIMQIILMFGLVLFIKSKSIFKLSMIVLVCASILTIKGHVVYFGSVVDKYLIFVFIISLYQCREDQCSL